MQDCPSQSQTTFREQPGLSRCFLPPPGHLGATSPVVGHLLPEVTPTAGSHTLCCSLQNFVPWSRTWMACCEQAWGFSAVSPTMLPTASQPPPAHQTHYSH